MHKIKRRDFLAGIGTGLAAPLLARAAFALNPREGPPSDVGIERVGIYPPLGISRVGNSPEWFLAPEVAGLPPVADGHYKDRLQRVKKQVQRFRIFAFNGAGQVIRELTCREAKIDWTVHVANTKAAWYGFNNPLDNGEEAPGLPGMRRNQFIVDPVQRSRMLVIDPGPRTIGGAALDPQQCPLSGHFWEGLEVELGRLGTDSQGRLLVFPGDGVSESAVPDNPIQNFSDNDGWHDDWADGPVQARVTLADGRQMTAESAWVACVGPDFAPDIAPFISLYDVLEDVNLEAGWSQPREPLSFRKYIYPFFHRMALMAWIAAADNLHQGWIGVGNLADPEYIARLADPGAANRAFRHQVLSAFRDPGSTQLQQYKLPYMLGDGVNYSGSPLRWFRIPKRQYALLQAWAEGRFLNDLDLTGPEPRTLEQLPLSEQPEALTRAALEACSGGAFHPGVELSWPLRHRELYSGPFRIKLAGDRPPDLLQDLGLLLTPEKAFGGQPPTPPAIGPQMPGDLTRWMGLPWQCDAFSCQKVLFANDFPRATWWPAQLPIDVLPELYYEAVMNPKLDREERLRFYGSRVAWSRGVAGIGYHAEASYSDGLNSMLYHWHQMGFVVRRPGPTDAGRPREIPSQIYVEVDRGSMDPLLKEAPFQGPAH